MQKLRHTRYRNIVKARKARSLKGKQPQRTNFWRFMLSSASCATIDQLLAWLLFGLLGKPLGNKGFLHILVANVSARIVSLTLNYALNRRLVFTLDTDDPEWQASSRRESLPRFIALSAVVLALSTLGVFLAHRFLDVPEWQAKVVVDIALFFLNYNVQRKWVFKNDVSVRM